MPRSDHMSDHNMSAHMSDQMSRKADQSDNDKWYK